jgi:1-acyl-sn-glycerol-3-phosphate acyltransferase
MQNIRDMLHMGFNVVLFPEGTTSDGREVKPFKTSFLDVASGGGSGVLPLCIRYKKINGKDIDSGSGPLVYYYGDIGFFEHFFRLLGLSSISVEVMELEAINPGLARKELAEVAFQRISAAYREGFGSRDV